MTSNYDKRSQGFHNDTSYNGMAWMPHPLQDATSTYNSTQSPLKMPEYGRLVQDMVNYALQVEDRSERQAYAEAIVSVMMGLSPKMKDVPDFQHKIWDHLAQIADYKLDIDYPYPVEKPKEHIRPRTLSYPKGYIRFRHYGRLIEKALAELHDAPESEERDRLTRLVANRMKRNLADWKGDGVEDSKVARDISYYTEGNVQPEFTQHPLIRITENKFRTRKNKSQQ